MQEKLEKSFSFVHDFLTILKDFPAKVDFFSSISWTSRCFGGQTKWIATPCVSVRSTLVTFDCFS